MSEHRSGPGDEVESAVSEVLFEQTGGFRKIFKKSVRITPDGIEVGDHSLSWDDIVSISSHMSGRHINGTLEGRFRVDLFTSSGEKTKIRAKSSGKKKFPVLAGHAEQVLALLADNLPQRQWPRVRREIADGSYTVGKTTFTAAGLHAGGRQVAWHDVEGAVWDQDTLIFHTTSGEVISTEKGTVDDALLANSYIQLHLADLARAGRLDATPATSPTVDAPADFSAADVAVPDTPAPHVSAPDVPTPDGPAPDGPAPDDSAPEPAAPEPATPAASAPRAAPTADAGLTRPTATRSPAGSPKRRALLGVALIIGFFAIGILAVIASGALAVWLITSVERIPVVLIILPFVIAFGVIAAFVRLLRKAKLPDVGVPLDLRQHPQLQDVIGTIATSMTTPMPDHVRVIHDVNAFVAQESRLLGLIPGKRMLGIGAPLLATLTVSQLTAVLAHEFGHYAGGDTRLSGLTYAGQEAMIRSVEVNRGNIAGMLFAGYTKFYLRVTQQVSRQQELDADAAAVALGGREAMSRALVAVEHQASAFEEFIGDFVEPLWRHGQHPERLYQGFAQRQAARTSDERMTIHPTSRPADPYDSHPPLDERLAAIAALPESATIDDDRPAHVLLDDADDVFGRIGLWLADKAVPEPLTAVGWDIHAEVHARETADFAEDVGTAWAAEVGSPVTLSQLIQTVDVTDQDSAWWRVARRTG